MYIPLHAHDCAGSIGDSILQIKDYVKQAKELSLPAIGLTNHGSMASTFEFYEECTKNNIKPIIGLEVYWCKDRLLMEPENKKTYHLILLAKNEVGLKNLIKINNDAAVNGFYYKPRTDDSILKKYSEGVIALSACVGGEIPQLILNQEINKAKERIQFFKETFSDFYLEIQPGNFSDQKIVNETLILLSKEMNIPLVMTNDIHYLNKEDSIAHDLHVKINRKKTLVDEPGLSYPDDCYYFMKKEEILSHCNDIKSAKDAIRNTIIITELCENYEYPIAFKMPSYTNKDEHDILTRRCYESLLRRINTLADPQQYVDRLEYELDVIQKLGFCGYFLIVQDFLNHAKQNDIMVGPGRGSVGGSVVAWLLDIVKADPIKHNLLFERFLSVNRKSLPDIDIDIISSKRDLMQHYAVEKYGKSSCALVSTTSYRKAKKAIRDVARVMSIDLSTADEIAKLIPTVYYDDAGEKTVDLSISESLKVVPELKAYQEKYPKLFQYAIELEDLPAAASIHAAGVVISPYDLTEKIPLIRSNKEGILATSYDKNIAEKFAIKFDFLALKNLDIINDTLRTANIQLNMNDEFFEDESVWDIIGSKNTTGLFQISSPTYKRRMHRLKPKNIDELATCLALVRGPCISAKADEAFMQILEGKAQIRRIETTYDAVTKETNGILVFQEQLMNLCVAYGIDMDTSYDILKASSKKKIEKLKSYKNLFFEKTKAKNISSTTAEEIWKLIVDSGKYSFNKSHAVGYSLITYICAWLKIHYPAEYTAALFTNFYLDKKEADIKSLVKECRERKIKILPPDINASSWHCTAASSDTVRIGFCAIKSLGDKAGLALESCQPFSDYKDFEERVNKRIINRKIRNLLILSDTFSSFGKDRIELFQSIKDNDGIESVSIGGNQKISIHDTKKEFEKKVFLTNF